MEIPSKIQTRIDQGYPFRVMEYLSQGWALVIRRPLQFMGFTSIFFGLQLGLSMIPLFGLFGLMLVVAPLDAGFYLGAYDLKRNGTTSLQAFFKGFDFLLPLMTQYLLVNIAYGILLAPLFISLFSGIDLTQLISSDTLDPEEFATLEAVDPWTMVWIIPLIYLAVAWRWAPMFIVFYRMHFWQALETSRQLITRHWGVHFMLVLVMVMLYLSGLFLFLIGVLLAYPLMKSIDYAAFADVTGLYEAHDNHKEDTVDHLID